VDENIQFCVLVEEVLQHLGFTMKPFYVTKHYIEPWARFEGLLHDLVYICAFRRDW
jgi:hypothetical protein